MDEMKKEQMTAIKNRLLNHFHNSGLSIYKLLEEIKDASGFSLNYDTFRKTLDPNSTTLDIYSVIALCRYWNLDLSYILSSPDNTEIPMPSTENLVNSSKFSILNDPKYAGTYYGYIHSAKKVFSHIDYFELTISESCGKFQADMVLHAFGTANEGRRTEVQKHLTGVPIHVHPNAIFIILTNDAGELFIIFFNYVPYRSNNLYFKLGFLMTCATEISRPVLMQKFALFSQPVPPAKMKYIPGFLLLNDHTFHIPASVVDQLKNTEPSVQKLFDDFGYLLEYSRKDVYCINESQFLNSYSSSLSSNDIHKALTILKSFASDANRIVITDSTALAEFSKLLQ